MRVVSLGLLVTLLTGCAVSKQDAVTDVNMAFMVASASEHTYAARPKADPKVVAELGRLLMVAQVALAVWAASSAPADQQIAATAVAALVSYEASAPAG